MDGGTTINLPGADMMASAPKRQTELEAALMAARDRMEHLEQTVALVAASLEPVLPQGYFQNDVPLAPEEDIPAGSMRAVEVFALARRIEKAASKLATLAQAVEV